MDEMETKVGDYSIRVLGFFLYGCIPILNMTALHISVFKIKIAGRFRNSLENIHLK